ncbi:MAG: glycerol kinase GlpK [Gammaproteobacteria bacterium]
MSTPLILAIDQGTTSTRAIAFDANGEQVGTAQEEFNQIFPHDGWVEHDPEQIWGTALRVCKLVLAKLGARARDVAVAGITNQRETTIVWDRETGEPVYNAIVWQDRRTADTCERLEREGREATFSAKTGLLLDPYFSGTKIAWILDNVSGAREAAEAGRLAFGTTDSLLLWKLTAGRVHATDATNASRTLLYNIHEGRWDEELLELLNVPASMLPDVRDSSCEYGQSDAEVLGRSLTIGGIAGDQQAATVGQACFEPGMIKSTYGTGCFALINTGERAVTSNHRLLTTIAYQLDGKTTYAIEGSIFIAGAAVQWLRDGLKIIHSAPVTEALAAGLKDNRGLYMVPAFTGLGAPYWDAHARGALFGITRDTGVPEIARATLESVCYQTSDLTEAMTGDARAQGAEPPRSLRVDGGMAANNWLMQFLADVLNLRVDRPIVTETTALGAAYLAGLNAGIFGSLDDIAQRWRLERSFEPDMAEPHRTKLLAGWKKAVSRTRETDTA